MSIYEDISKKLDELHEKMKPDDLNWLEDARKIFSIFTKGEKLIYFVKTLECICKELKAQIEKIENEESKKREKEKLNKVYGLLKELKSKEPDFLIENLRRAGYAIASRNKSLKDAVEKELLRILEQTRLGKRDNVVHMLIRNFVIRQEHIPDELIYALKPQYDTNLFRAFIYAFLSGFISERKEE